MFVTMVGGIYDPACGTVCLANAGHQPPLVKSATGQYREISTSAPPLGILPDIRFEETEFRLGHDSLYLYTDGITETRISAQHDLGVAGMQGLIDRNEHLSPRERLEAIISELGSSGYTMNDDVTVMVIENSAAANDRLLDTRIPARADQLKPLREAVRAALAPCGCTGDALEHLVLAVNEACMNIIQHAYGDDEAGEILVEIINNGQQLEFRITDFADPIDIESIKPRRLDEVRPGGLGTHFIQEVMDEVDYSNSPDASGNLLIMRKTL
jgi:sigma-B regulation protein RsbU (phosphoserine phosphatase)